PPGGSRATMADMDATAAPYGDIVALYPSHCFIPTVSALAYDIPDLFHVVASDPDPLAHSPFDAVYVPDQNQEHVAITPQNAAWIRSEIEQGVTGVLPGSAVAGIHRGRPAPNPSSGPVRLAFTLPRAGDVDLRVVAVDGREIARLARGRWEAGTHGVEWAGIDRHGAPAPPGVYFVRL